MRAYDSYQAVRIVWVSRVARAGYAARKCLARGRRETSRIPMISMEKLSVVQDRGGKIRIGSKLGVDRNVSAPYHLTRGEEDGIARPACISFDPKQVIASQSQA